MANCIDRSQLALTSYFSGDNVPRLCRAAQLPLPFLNNCLGEGDANLLLNLVGAYNGNNTDLSGNGNDLSDQGPGSSGSGQGPDGSSGTAISLTGSQSVGTGSALVDSGDLTVSVAVNPSSPNDPDGTIFSITDTNGNPIVQVGVTGGYIVLVIANANGTTTITSILPALRYTYRRYTYITTIVTADGQVIVLLNDNEVQLDTQQVPPVDYTGAANTSFGGNNYDGLIAQMYVYNRVLLGSEVVQLIGNGAGAVIATPPAAPEGLNANGGNTIVNLTWDAVSGATSYNLYRGLAENEETLAVSDITGTTYTDTGRTNGTPYYYYVTAVNGAGESASSGQTSAMPHSGGGS